MTLSARLLRVQLRLPRAASNARAAWASRDGVAIEITYDGTTGRAEAAPLPSMSLETLDAAIEALAGARWAGIDPDADDPISIAARLVPDEVPSARFAIEAALFDLVGKRRGLSVAAMLTETEPAAVVQSAALLDDLDTALADGLAARGAGVTAVKLKIGRAGAMQREIDTLRTLRRELGTGIAIRADANGTLEEASSPLVNALADVGAELIEEPYSLDRVLDEPPLPLPVALDESLARDPIRALRALERKKAHALVLKPTLLGGLGRSLALAEAAKERGARAIVSHLYDAPRAFAACAHLALALGPGEVHGLSRYPGLHLWHEETNQPIPVPAFVVAAHTVRPSEGGLG